MNEITKIHLGRQAFTIAVDAHKALQEYLHAIKRQLGTKGEDVLKEIELRMVELLAERGVSGDKVILLDDIEYLKEQLGSPKDFTEGDSEDDDNKEKEKDKDKKEPEGDGAVTKRLFRDTDRGIIAGVAAGLAAYLKVDPVFVRLSFVLLTLFWGWGIILYIILWLIIPEAKSSSNRLQMQGKAVTVANIKETVNKADVPGATKRAGRTFGRFLERLGVVLVAIGGFAFIITGAAMFIGTITATMYWMLRKGQISDMVVFPVGANEVWLLLCGVISAVILSLLVLFIGIAMVRRKWTLPGWVVATMIGIFLVASSIGTALGFHVAPGIERRVDALRQHKTVVMQEFTSVTLKGHDTRFSYVPSDVYSVKLSYTSGKDRSDRMQTNVENGNLTVSVLPFNEEESCTFICLYSEYDLEVVIYAPSLDTVTLDGSDSSFESLEVLDQKDMTLILDLNSFARISYVYPEKVSVDETKNASYREVKLQGIRAGEFRDQDVNISDDYVYVNHSDVFELTTERVCEEYEPLVYLPYISKPLPTDLIINGEGGLHMPGVLESKQDTENMNTYNCVIIDRTR